MLSGKPEGEPGSVVTASLEGQDLYCCASFS